MALTRCRNEGESPSMTPGVDTHYRIAQAQRMLATTDEKVIDIAFAAGFRTSSRFDDAFRRACGCSPNRYRKEHVH